MRPMTVFDAYLERHTSIARLLATAGMDPSFIQTDRAFASNWAWDDGKTAFATVWLHEILDPDGVPKWSATNPALRTDLAGNRRARAKEIFEILVRRAGQPIRVILQKQKPDRTQWAWGVSSARGVDPEPWFSFVEGETVLLQRGSLPGSRKISVGGEPMPLRDPTFALRETRPDQVAFRKLVAAKSGNRCALTGAPAEVCDAAHFPWANWRTDNEARHGLLLRRDLHAALDSSLIEIEPSGRVIVSEYLASSSEAYLALHGRLVATEE